MPMTMPMPDLAALRDAAQDALRDAQRLCDMLASHSTTFVSVRAAALQLEVSSALVRHEARAAFPPPSKCSGACAG